MLVALLCPFYFLKLLVSIFGVIVVDINRFGVLDEWQLL
jgi:hypothetical protein